VRLLAARLVAFVVVATAVLQGCAGVPTGPSVLVLPGNGKTPDQFHADDLRCREGAASELRSTPKGTVSDQGRYDMAYMQCMYAQGNQVPLPGRGWRSRSIDRPPPLPGDVRPLPTDPPQPAR
jgi:hypothetical protein